MKKIHIALLASLACFFAVSCDKEEDDTPLYTTNSFKVEAPEFVDENGSKVYLRYTDEASSLIYEEGDQVYINGHAFTLVQDGGWRAISNDGEPITGKRFLVTYVDGEVSHFDSAASTYQFNLNATLASSDYNKIILGGVAENAGDYVIKLKPACAILRINTGGAGASWTYAKVGFEANKVPKAGTINVSDRTLGASGSNYLAGVTSGGAGQFLNMRYSNPSTTGEDDYWYVAIPIVGSSVTTTLYLEWNNGSSTVQHKTQGQVTLRKGYVYTLGTERQSPFNADGTTKSKFRVDGNSRHTICFSPGNLQATFNGTDVEWRFAPSQTDYIGSSNYANMQGYGLWYDLFGFGTSEWGGSGASEYYSNSTSYESSEYIQHDLTGTWANADWGVFNSSSIKYGSVTTTTTWRTLTKDEWSYLIGRSGKCAPATVGGVKGIILLPDVNVNGLGWNDERDLADCPAFNSTATNYSTNVYTFSDWDKFESAGVIFLPAAGYREGSSVTLNCGRYWSSSYSGFDGFDYLAFALKFLSGTSASVSDEDNLTSKGCSVRLIHQNWN